MDLVQTFTALLQSLPWAGEQIFWNVLWIASGTALVSLLFSLVEAPGVRASSGGTIAYGGSKRTIGLAIIALGLVGLLACIGAWMSIGGDLTRGAELLVRHTAGAVNPLETAVLWLTVASLVAFDIGVYMSLSSEQRVVTGKTTPH